MSTVLDEVVTSLKKVKVISTVGINKTVVEIDPEVKTWGDLKRVFDDKGIKYSGMSATIGETTLSLILDEAVLPTTDFTLFILPTKVDSGAHNYTQVQLDAVQKTFASKKGAAVCAAKLGISVEDYINMRNILKGKPTTSVAPVVASPVVEVPTPIVELKRPILDRLKDLKEDLLLELDEDDDTMVELQSIIDDLEEVPTEQGETEAERLDREETEALLKQAKSLEAKLKK